MWASWDPNPLGPAILYCLSLCFHEGSGGIRDASNGEKKNGFAWKANLGTTLSVEPTQTERCCVRTVQGP